MPTKARTPWYEATKEDLGAAVMGYARHLESELSQKFDRDRLYMTMWGGEEYLPDDVDIDLQRSLEQTNPAYLGYNLVFSAIDTVVPTISVNEPRIKYLTNGGSWDLQRRARKRSLVMLGEFDESRMGELGPQTLTDAAILGTGAATVVNRGGRPRVQRCRPFEWRVDPNEAEHTDEPLNYQRIRMVDRQILQKLLGKDLSHLSHGFEEFNSLGFLRRSHHEYVDYVVLIETYRLAMDDESPGRYAAVVGGEVVDERPYKSTRPPAVFLHWQPRQTGFYGKGLTEIVYPHQCELNYLDMKIADIMDLASKLRVFTFGGGYSPEEIDNSPVEINELSGPQHTPVFVNPNVVPSELFEQRQETIRVAFEAAGVSEARVAGKKPAGVVSAVGQREANDIADNRQKPKMVRYEEFFVGVARAIGNMKDELLSQGIDKPVGVGHKLGRSRVFDLIKWKDAQLNPGQERVTVDAASSLPLQSAARQEVLQEWFGAGLISRAQFMHLNNLPDMEAFADNEVADYEMVLDYVDDIFERGEQTYPNPTDNLDMTVELMVKANNRFRRLNAPQDRLDMLDLHIELARQMRDAAAPSGQPQQAVAAPGAEVPQAPQPGPEAGLQ